MSKDTGGPAFPLPLGTANCSEPEQSGGMTLRDYFAAKALLGLIPEEDEHMREWLDDLGDEQTSREAIARAAYFIADAMLRERAK